MSIERTFISYISQVLNVKVENDFVLEDIKTELKEISNMSETALIEFRTFIKNNLKHIDLNYLTGFQKFIKLSEMFKNICRDSISRGIDLKARDLSLKLRRVINSENREHLLDSRFKFEFVKTKGSKYFTDKELHILDKLQKKRVYGAIFEPYILEQMLLSIYKSEAQKVFNNKIRPGNQLIFADLAKNANKKTLTKHHQK